MEWTLGAARGSSGGKRATDRRRQLEASWAQQTGEQHIVYSAYGVSQGLRHAYSQPGSMRPGGRVLLCMRVLLPAQHCPRLPPQLCHEAAAAAAARLGLQSPYECFFVKAPKVTPLDEEGSRFQASCRGHCWVGAASKRGGWQGGCWVGVVMLNRYQPG